MTSEAEMLLLRGWSPEEVCNYLATKVRAIRKRTHESQEEFALRAGVPLRTYKRFETHGKGSLETFVQVLRAIDRTHYLFMLFPQPGPGPLNVKPSLEQRLSQLRPTKFL
ncbi:helix-turn-helix domain-containing protein [Variovorax saccharolyticus]|uniref:helix-turn-helix domain-containing protein n=1 Tax=Variovorax saccharolyticus TaxID=3053516 RepID=UPI002576B354|nr:helix-turn-helix transcriptional regulator [Variovorax sp. J22R187]MDM0018003.1 helix-turn-helix transcriptional regulator [Variovorax sp. J22R187]